MEEKKNKTMGVAKEGTPEKEQQKLSYEELNEVCGQLYQENQKLMKQLQQMNMTNMFKRLDYLFLVLQNEQVIKDPEFVGNCVEEIKEALYPAEEEKED